MGKVAYEAAYLKGQYDYSQAENWFWRVVFTIVLASAIANSHTANAN